MTDERAIGPNRNEGAESRTFDRGKNYLAVIFAKMWRDVHAVRFSLLGRLHAPAHDRPTLDQGEERLDRNSQKRNDD